MCNEFAFSPSSGRVAYKSPWWTWGGSPILADDGMFHMFSSQISNNCGILHYCSNSQVIHLTSPNATGPYTLIDTPLPARLDSWDNGATHGISVHRLPNKSYALFYMGSAQGPAWKRWPNCTAGSGDKTANTTEGSHNGRRIGIAIADDLNGPWRRLNAPLFGPQKGAWDNIDVSNPSPIIKADGSVIMLYKGRGDQTQHMGIAYADSVDGPYKRNNSGITEADLPGEDPWGWIDAATGIVHAVFHTGNGNSSAGTHCWSKDGVVWKGQDSTPVYTGQMEWAKDTYPPYAGTHSVLTRRERPQILLDGVAGSSYGTPRVLFTSAEDCDPKVDAGTGVPCTGKVGTDKSYTVLAEIAA